MAYYSIFPEIDATVYSHPDRFTMNTGHDEILELVKEKGSSDQRYYPSRILIKFSNDDIKSTITDVVTPLIFNLSKSIEEPEEFVSCSVSLRLFSTEHKNLPTIQTIEAYAISQSWEEGSGRFTNLPTSSNGVSWKFRDNDTDGTIWATQSFAVGTTGSISSSTLNPLTEGGGTWYTGSSFYSTQQFINADVLDTNIDVTKIVHKFSASFFNFDTEFDGIENNGFLIKLPTPIEENISSSLGQLKYFSSDTHTIYPPKLTFKWDDSVDSNPSTSRILDEGELSVSLYNNKEEYNQNEIAKFRLQVRNKYPDRSFTTTSNFLKAFYFTTKSYYSIRDAHTEEEIIPFDDNFTKLSSDSNGMYFNVYMKGLQPERYYRLLFKHINNDGTTVYDNNYHFKVIR